MVRSKTPVLLAVVFVSGCASGTSSNGVPSALLALESAAEDAYDHALANDLSTLSDDATLIAEQWRQVRPKVVSDGALTQDVDAMDAAVSGFQATVGSETDPTKLARSANGISFGMDEMFALYDDAVPSDVLALDYLGRELSLDGREMDFTGAEAHVSTLEAIWNALASTVTAADGKTEADQFAAAIQTLRADIAAADATNLELDSNVALELVDDIEHVFE